MNKQTMKTAGMYIQMALGLLLGALAYRMFLIPNDIAAGGFTGIGQLVNVFTGWSVGAVSLCLNVPLFLVSMKRLGLSFGIRSFAATVILSVLIDYLPVGAVTNDALLAAVFGGALAGVGFGLILRGDATTGGSDMLGKLVHRFAPIFSVGAVTFAIDALVIVASGFVFDATKAMFALIAAYLMVRLLDAVLEGPNLAKAYYIISAKNDVIAKRIMTELDRGVTGLNAKGMYSGRSRTVLLCVIGRLETMKLRRIVSEEDANAFMIATNVHEALGEGFSAHDE